VYIVYLYLSDRPVFLGYRISPIRIVLSFKVKNAYVRQFRIFLFFSYLEVHSFFRQIVYPSLTFTFVSISEVELFYTFNYLMLNFVETRPRFQQELTLKKLRPLSLTIIFHKIINFVKIVTKD
jgi:hypothetical protein